MKKCRGQDPEKGTAGPGQKIEDETHRGSKQSGGEGGFEEKRHSCRGVLKEVEGVWSAFMGLESKEKNDYVLKDEENQERGEKKPEG